LGRGKNRIRKETIGELSGNPSHEGDAVGIRQS
jgi:hypothetical protein